MLSAALTIFAGLISIVKSIFGMKSNQQLIDAGKAEQAADSERAARKEVETARRVEADAGQKHAKDNSDDAFDKSFERKD